MNAVLASEGLLYSQDMIYPEITGVDLWANATWNKDWYVNMFVAVVMS